MRWYFLIFLFTYKICHLKQNSLIVFVFADSLPFSALGHSEHGQTGESDRRATQHIPVRVRSQLVRAISPLAKQSTNQNTFTRGIHMYTLFVLAS